MRHPTAAQTETLPPPKRTTQRGCHRAEGTPRRGAHVRDAEALAEVAREFFSVTVVAARAAFGRRDTFLPDPPPRAAVAAEQEITDAVRAKALAAKAVGT
jgi:hypothetical protein